MAKRKGSRSSKRSQKAEPEVVDESAARKKDIVYRIMFFAGLIFIFTGLDLVILLSKLNRLTGVPFLVIGIILVYYSSTKRHGGKEEEEEDVDEDELEKNPYNQSPLMRLVTFNGKLVKYMWAVGLLLIILDIGYTFLIDPKRVFASFDYVVLAIGGAIFLYRFIPKDMGTERDFALILLVMLFFILVMPTMISAQMTDEVINETNSPLVKTFLVGPMLWALGILGITAEASGAILRYELQSGGFEEVAISLSCSGIYSLSLFISGFVAYLLVERKKFGLPESLFLVGGVLIAYVGNLIRMVAIVMIGSHYGEEAFLTAHAYLGEAIFVAWIVPFWGILFAAMWYIDKKREGSAVADSE